MNERHVLPSKVEEALAETAGCLIRSRILMKYDLIEILKRIALEMRLQPRFKRLLSDPDWLKVFQERWSHKLYFGGRPLSNQLQGDSVSEADDDNTNVPSAKHTNGTGTMARDTSNHSFRNGDDTSRVCNSAVVVVEEFPPSDCSRLSSLPTGPLSVVPDVRDDDQRISDILQSTNSAEMHKLNKVPTENIDDLGLPDSIKKKASMGLRVCINPVKRLQYGTVKRFPRRNEKRLIKWRQTSIETPSTSVSDSEGSDTISPSKHLERDMKSIVSYVSLRDKLKAYSSEIKGYTHTHKRAVVVKKMQGKKQKRDLLERTDSDEPSRQLPRRIKPVDHFQSSLTQRHKTKYNFRSALLRSPRKKRKKAVEIIELSSSDEESSSTSDDASTSMVLSTTTSQKTEVRNEQDKGRGNFELVHAGIKELEDLCLACGTTENISAKHPLFVGGLCDEHKLLLREWFFQYDDDGYHSVCSVCCMGKKVVLCDVQDCGRCYCKDCLDTLMRSGTFAKAVSSERWVCNFCVVYPEEILRKRPEWQEEIQRLFQHTGESAYPPFHVPIPVPVKKRRPIRVLSLFDGIATGIVALKQLGLQIEKFVASEIDEDAIRLVQNKHPEVVHIGDITKITDGGIYKMGPFDLLLGGSPCNDLSGANPRRRGLLDPEGSGCLFFDFYRILRTVEPPRTKDDTKRRPFFWLFENVVSMKRIEKERISRFLQCEPKMADARYVSAAARPRLFWGNLPGLKDQKIAPGVKDRLTVQECLEPNRTAQVEKLNTITTKYTCLYQGSSRTAPVMHKDKEDVLWTTELERVFGVPEHYTDVNNLGPRERLALLGRSWSVPVVRQLLAPLKEYFSGVQQLPEEQKCTSGSWWS